MLLSGKFAGRCHRSRSPGVRPSTRRSGPAGRIGGMTISFPRQSARTRRFTLGAPRGFLVSSDGSRVVFLRSRHGTDPVTCLWTVDVGDDATGEERLVVDPRALDLPGEEDLPAEERARRERAREQAGGVTAYAADRDLSMAAFALSGRLFVTDLDKEIRPLDAVAPVFDPRPVRV